MLFALAVFSFLGLCLETGLQLFLLASDISANSDSDSNTTSNANFSTDNSTASLHPATSSEDTTGSYRNEILTSCYLTVVLLLLGLVATNLASLLLALRKRELKNCGVREKIACFVLHVLQLGLAWRAYIVHFRFSEEAWLNVAELRLIHVSLTSFPYLVLQGRLMFLGPEMGSGSDGLPRAASSPLPVLTLLVTLVSCSEALCAFVLRYKLHEAMLLERADPATKTTKRTVASFIVQRAGIVVLVTGTFLCVTSRLGSLSLLSAQHGFWVLLAFGGHFLALVAIQFCCWRMSSARAKGRATRDVDEVTRPESALQERLSVYEGRGDSLDAGSSQQHANAVVVSQDHCHERDICHCCHHKHQSGSNIHKCSAETSERSHGSSARQSRDASFGGAQVLAEKTSANSHNSAIASYPPHDFSQPECYLLKEPLRTSSGPSQVDTFSHTNLDAFNHVGNGEQKSWQQAKTATSPDVQQTSASPQTAPAEAAEEDRSWAARQSEGCSCLENQLRIYQVLKVVSRCYLSTVDLVEEDLRRVQCRYVSFYSVMLVENLAMTASWLLPAGQDYTTKLLLAVGLLGAFLAGLVFKFTSCGCIVAASTVTASRRGSTADHILCTIEIPLGCESSSPNGGSRRSSGLTSQSRYNGCRDVNEDEEIKTRTAPADTLQISDEETVRDGTLVEGLTTSAAIQYQHHHHHHHHDRSESASGTRRNKRAKKRYLGGRQEPRHTKVQEKLAPILTNPHLLLSHSNHLHHLHRPRGNLGQVGEGVAPDVTEGGWPTETAALDSCGGDVGSGLAFLEDPLVASKLVLESLRSDHQDVQHRDRSRSADRSNPRSKHRHSDQSSCDGYYQVSERNLSDQDRRSRKELFLPRRSLEAVRDAAGAYRYVTRCTCRGSPTSTPRRRPQRLSMLVHPPRRQRADGQLPGPFHGRRSRSEERVHHSRHEARDLSELDGTRTVSNRSSAAKDSSVSASWKKKRTQAVFPVGRKNKKDNKIESYMDINSFDRAKEEKQTEGPHRHTHHYHHHHQHHHHRHQQEHIVSVHHSAGCRLHGIDLHSNRALTWPRRGAGQEADLSSSQRRELRRSRLSRRRPRLLQLQENYPDIHDVVRRWLQGLEDPDPDSPPPPRDAPQQLPPLPPLPQPAHLAAERSPDRPQDKDEYGFIAHRQITTSQTSQEDRLEKSRDHTVMRVGPDIIGNIKDNPSDGVKVFSDDGDDYGFKTVLRQKAERSSASESSSARKAPSPRLANCSDVGKTGNPSDGSLRPVGDQLCSDLNRMTPGKGQQQTRKVSGSDAVTGLAQKPPMIPFNSSADSGSNRSSHSGQRQAHQSPHSSDRSWQLSPSGTQHRCVRSDLQHPGEPRSRIRTEGQEKSSSDLPASPASVRSREQPYPRVSLSTAPDSDGSRSSSTVQGQGHALRSRLGSRCSETSQSVGRMPDISLSVTDRRGPEPTVPAYSVFDNKVLLSSASVQLLAQSAQGGVCLDVDESLV